MRATTLSISDVVTGNVRAGAQQDGEVCRGVGIRRALRPWRRHHDQVDAAAVRTEPVGAVRNGNLREVLVAGFRQELAERVELARLGDGLVLLHDARAHHRRALPVCGHGHDALGGFDDARVADDLLLRDVVLLLDLRLLGQFRRAVALVLSPSSR